jgi:hypothetical protein
MTILFNVEVDSDSDPDGTDSGITFTDPRPFKRGQVVLE